jgi:hypothetical protein
MIFTLETLIQAFAQTGANRVYFRRRNDASAVIVVTDDGNELVAVFVLTPAEQADFTKAMQLALGKLIQEHPTRWFLGFEDWLPSAVWQNLQPFQAWGGPENFTSPV